MIAASWLDKIRSAGSHIQTIILAIITHWVWLGTGCQSAKENSAKFPLEIIKEEEAVKIDLRYKTAENITGRRLYPQNFQAYTRPEVLSAISRAAETLKPMGYGLLILDAWRPPVAAALLWNSAVEQGLRWMYAPPGISGHTRGSAVDVTLFSLDGDEEIRMPGNYDCHQSGGLSTAHSVIMKNAMNKAGFTGHPEEWWHFDYPTQGESAPVDNPWEKSGLRIVTQ